MRTLDEIRQQANIIVQQVAEDGGSGEVWFGRVSGSVIWSNGGGWEHVSFAPFKRYYTPSWDDMCRIKNIFFYPEEWAVQYHPAESEYVNNVPNCLHLWRPIDQELPTPPSWMVGAKKGQTMREAYMVADKELTSNGGS